MVDPNQLALIHAEIDGTLSERERAQLSRGLLADPALREVREEMRRLCRALDAIPEVQPPRQLRDDILAALPQIQPRRARRTGAGQQWRIAAVLAGVLLTGAIVFRTLDFGQAPALNEMSGTLAAPRAAVTVDVVQITDEGVSGRASLIREGAELSLMLELTPKSPVDVLVASGGHTVRVNHLAMAGSPEKGPTRIALPGVGSGGESVRVTFLRDGREVGHAVLKSATGG